MKGNDLHALKKYQEWYVICVCNTTKLEQIVNIVLFMRRFAVCVYISINLDKLFTLGTIALCICLTYLMKMKCTALQKYVGSKGFSILSYQKLVCSW